MESFTNLFGDSPLVFAILGAELAFWAFLFGGLAVRYLLRMRRLSSVLLLGVPVVDVVLIALTVIDLGAGTPPNFSHSLAAIYLGFTIAFGHGIIRSVDGWFAHRFADGPRPAVRPKSGPVYVRRTWMEWVKMVVAVTIASGSLLLMIAFSGWHLPADGDFLSSEEPLWSMATRMWMVVGVWFVAGPLYAVVFRSKPSEQDGVTRGATERTSIPR